MFFYAIIRLNVGISQNMEAIIRKRSNKPHLFIYSLNHLCAYLGIRFHALLNEEKLPTVKTQDPSKSCLKTT